MTVPSQNVCFVEHWTAGVSLPLSARVVGLTPSACWALDEAHVPHEIIEDFIDLPQIVRDAERFASGARRWIDAVDDWLSPQFDVPGMRPALAYYAQLFPTISAVALRARELSEVLDRLRPAHVTYVWNAEATDVVRPTLSYALTPSLFSRLTPLMAARRGIAFDQRVVPKPAPPFTTSPPRRSLRAWTASRPQVFRAFSDWQSIRATRRAKRSISLRLLFLNLNGYLRKMMTESVRAGACAYYRSDTDIIRQHVGWHRSVAGAPNVEAPPLAFDDQRFDAFVATLGDLCGTDVSTIFGSRLRYFVKTLSPGMAQAAVSFRRLFERFEIDAVVMSNRTSIADYAAVEAARLSAGTRAVYVNHGDDVFDQRWRETLVDQFDVFYEASDEVAQHLRSRPLARAAIAQQSDRYSLLPRRRQHGAASRPVLVYVPMMFGWDDTLWNEALCPDTWYFRWQVDLARYLAKRTDYDIVWKAFPQSGSTPDPMPAVLNSTGVDHIRYQTEPFIHWIPRADRVLIDFPSTAAYEAAVAGLPVLSLYAPALCRLRPHARESFGASLRPFASAEEGLRIVEEFLASDADRFRVRLPSHAVPFSETIGELLACA